MFKVFLDGTEYQEPKGLNDLAERIYYNEELAMYLNKLEGDVVFVGDAYNYLREQFTDSVCNKVSVTITETNDDIDYDGVIFLNDITWDLSKREAECKIVSDKFVELIDNNKGIEVQLGVNLGKDQETIIVDSAVTISVPNPTSTVFVNRIGYRIFDVFEALVRFMSNEELTFVSDYFDPANGNDPCYDVIMWGEELRLGAGNLSPLISYEKFFSDMNKLHNLAGVIEGNTLRIEPKSYFRTNETSTTLQNINDVSQELNREQFYASVKLGSAKVAEGYGYLIRLSYNGFQKEQFFLQGQCNIYNELDLQLQTLITDTNIIQDMLPVSSSGSNNSEYDEDIILLHCSQANTVILTDSPTLGTFYFNDYYTNRECSTRWSETYPFSIVQLLESVQPLVFARLTTEQDFSTNPRTPYFSPDDDVTPPYFDSGGDYQIGAINVTPSLNENVGYFQAPSDMVVIVEVDFFITGSYYQTSIICVDPSGNGDGSGGGMIDLNPNITFNQTYVYVQGYRVQGSATIYVPSGSNIYVSSLIGSDGFIHAGGEITINQVGSYGGVYQVVNSNNSFVSRTDFTYPTDANTWKAIREEPFKRVAGTYIDGGFTGFPIDIQRNISNGNTDFRLYQRKSEVNG